MGPPLVYKAVIEIKIWIYWYEQNYSWAGGPVLIVKTAFKVKYSYHNDIFYQIELY